ncbi:MAG: carbohydrate binding family 9 domain-containing protein, partial [Myxococcales bacterium]|nr:carbohydrate binding family 9 domain-containing protein [Myxococcales bacterium]
MRALGVIVVVVALQLAARAERPTPHLQAVRVSEPPTLDGKLDDAAWRAAPVMDSFVQKFPNEGTSPSEETTIRVIYDREAIWIGVDCRQKSAPIVARLTRRDRPIEADSITIDLDSRRSGANAFEFGVNAAGVLSDSIRFNDTDSSTDWDENWDARVARTADGWSAELRIPLRILRFDSLPL